MSIDKKNLCPNCGAKLTGLELVCPECGYTLRNESSGSQSVTDSLKDLQEKLIAVDKIYAVGASSSKKKASIINAFPIPNTTEALIRLLHLSYSNFEASQAGGDKSLSMAWLGKAVESYRRLEKSETNPMVAQTLDEYKVLADKKAFKKLSGSYRKRRWILLSGTLFIALLIAFVLWYDWAGFLMKRGNIDTATRLLSFMGRDEQAIELLVQGGLYESASQFALSKGQVVKAVNILAQSGAAEQSLKLIAQVNDAETVHACVDELEKYYKLGYRDKIFLDENYLINGNQVIKIIDHDYHKRVDSFILEPSTFLWYDYLGVFQDFVFPETPYYQSIFEHWYPAEYPNRKKDWDNTTITRNGIGEILEFVWGDYKYNFKYERTTGKIAAESLTYKERPVYELNYIYHGSSFLLEKVQEKYLMTQEELTSLFGTDTCEVMSELGVLPITSSTTTYFSYTDGKLTEARTCYDNYGDEYKDFPIRKNEFENYFNLVYRTDYHYKSSTESLEKSNNHTVRMYADGKLVERFSIAFE